MERCSSRPQKRVKYWNILVRQLNSLDPCRCIICNQLTLFISMCYLLSSSWSACSIGTDQNCESDDHVSLLQWIMFYGHPLLAVCQGPQLHWPVHFQFFFATGSFLLLHMNCALLFRLSIQFDVCDSYVLNTVCSLLHFIHILSSTLQLSTQVS
jgi:hypothetical protein